MFKSYTKTYLKVLLIALALIGLINFTIDPLWYFQGNLVTGNNPPWNERIGKTNLFLKAPIDRYDCYLLGTSRSTLFNVAQLTQNTCFNYSFSGGKIEEYVNYAQFVQARGVQPKRIYVEVDPNSFQATNRREIFSPVRSPISPYRTYFLSGNALSLSLRTLVGDYSAYRIYDRNFVGKISRHAPTFEPVLKTSENEQEVCDPEKIRLYQTLIQTFPNAEWIGFVAPVSAWFVFNNRYRSGLLPCQLAEVYRTANLFQRFYDFSVPSATTTRTDNTYDGNHYFPKVYDQIAEVLEQKRSDFGIDLKQNSLAAYQALYNQQLANFVQQQTKTPS